MTKIASISLDIRKNNTVDNEPIVLRQGDSDVIIEATISNNGYPNIEIDFATFVAKKPDGTIISNDPANVNGNVISYPISKHLTESVGKIQDAYFMINNQITTCSFDISIIPSAQLDDTSVNYIPGIENINKFLKSTEADWLGRIQQMKAQIDGLNVPDEFKLLMDKALSDAKAQYQPTIDAAEENIQNIVADLAAKKLDLQNNSDELNQTITTIKAQVASINSFLDSIQKQIIDANSSFTAGQQAQISQSIADSQKKLADSIASMQSKVAQTVADTKTSIQQIQQSAKNANDSIQNAESYLKSITVLPETFSNLAAIKAKYPSGKNGLMVAADNGHKYIWANNVWTDAGVYQSVGIAEKSLTAPMTNFLIKASILTDDIPVKIDTSLKRNIGISFDGALFDNPDNIVWYKVPVTGGRSYSAYYHEMPKLPTQLVIMEFQNGVSVKRYSVTGDNPTFVVDPATDYVHISLASNKADYTAVKIILSDASSRIGKNAVETDNNWEARLTKSESEIDNLTDKYLNRIKSGNSFVKSIGGFLPLSTDNVSADVSGSVNFSNKQRFADNSVMINSIYSSKSGRFKIDLGGTKSFEDLTLVFFAPVETNPDVTVKCSVSQDGAYSDALPATSINGKYSTGWNYVKLTPGLFRGLPTTADAIYLTITSRDSKTNGEIYGTLYLDSIIFDLKQTPVVCLSFDQLLQESFDNGAYQYLLDSGLPFSLYCRGWDDTSLVSAEWLDWAKNAEYNYGAELGVYGSYGDAQQAVNGATDYDSAKVNLAASWSAFFKTFGHAPATYAASQAFTSEFSLRAAKDVGFKIVRGGKLNILNAYLDKDTMQLPMTSLSFDTDADNIKGKIDNAIKYGYQLNLFTHGAYDTDSGSDHLKLADFKSMIDYLAEQRNLGKLKILTIDDYVTQSIKGVF